MSEYDGMEMRHQMRRESDKTVSVEVDGISNGARKLAVWMIRITGSVLVTLLVGFPVTWWRTSGWVTKTESLIEAQALSSSRTDSLIVSHITADDARTYVLMQAIGELDKTTTDIVANQRALRRDMSRHETTIETLRNGEN